MKKLNLLDEKNNIHQDTIEIFLDKGVVNRYKTLESYCKFNKLKIKPEDLVTFTQKIEKLIYNQVFYYAHLMYHYMEKSGDWGSPGEQQAKITFCRNLLKIDPKINLDKNHTTKFLALVKKTITQLKINTLSVQAAEQKLKDFKFKLFGKSFELFKGTLINKMLYFSGSKIFLHCGQYGKQMEFIMGSGKKISKQGYDITFVSKELIRTPNNVMSMAAIIGHQNIYIRLESLKVIFAQKWLQIFDYNEFEMLSIHSDNFWNIAEGIKLKVLEKYDIKTKEALAKKEKLFIQDMSETILYHELGHGIIQHNILPFDLGAIGEATKIFGENIYTAILEFLADFSPPNKEIKGPIQNIIDISKKDRNRAIRMYLMYMSDTWFYNTEDTYMYTYSDLMSLILIRYFTSNEDINFDLMEQELTHQLTKQTKTTHFNMILDIYKNDITEIKTMAENASFSTSDQTLDFNKIKEFLIGEFKKNDGFVHPDSYEFLVPFWTNILGYVQKISNSSDALTNYIKDQEEKAIKKIMILSCGKETAIKYNFDHRKYIVDRMNQLKILAIDTD